MPQLISKVALRERTRRRADMFPSDFVSNDEVDWYIQKSWEKLYNYLVGKYEGYFTKHATQADIRDYTTDTAGLTAGEKDYYFPADYFKLLRMSVGSTTANTGPWVDLYRTEWNHEHQLNSNDRRAKPSHYIIGGRNDYASAGARAEAFRLIPTPDAAYSMKIAYVPVAPDVDQINGVNGADEYVVIDAAIKCLAKEESDTGPLMLERKDWMAVVESAFIHRDVGQAPQMSISGFMLDEDYQEIGW